MDHEPIQGTDGWTVFAKGRFVMVTHINEDHGVEITTDEDGGIYVDFGHVCVIVPHAVLEALGYVRKGAKQ